ncbi:hypothetical protein [Streptomyces hygroscopicus]|uniref:hypothetical protein n=1 Tax=Streptomyces hygroscopicus TaxID=1912 RepID=UPI002240D72D|nr:hypothetical protein [Streptomyces hygroscopicus]
MSEGPINEVHRTTAISLPPVGSTERLGQQLLAEALLTDDGRVTDTPEAKTVAIEALARRMRSSTPALVLASMGLVVGNDMASHLSNGRYVLVPYNDRYPSMGADVLHVDELNPADPRHAAEKVVAMDSPRADTLVRMIAVSELMGSWAYGSDNNVRVLALQQAAQEEFSLAGVLEWHMDAKTRFAVSLELDYNRETLRDFLRTQYEMTQEVLASRGITEVLSYRALSWPESARRPDWAVDQNVGQVVEARQRPLASWSADRQIVTDWLEERRGTGVILAARLPARDILSLPTTGMGYLGQKEWVALPGDHRAVLDGIVSHTAPAATTGQSAAAAVSLGAPALAGAAHDQASAPIPAPGTAPRWRPLPITQQLNPGDPLDNRITRILDGAEPAPSWWPKDDSGYAITRRDLDFLGISPIQIRWLLTGEAPMGMTPELYQQFGSEMLAALERDGIDPSQVDIRLKGTGAGFFSGIHKTLPREVDVADNPLALQRLREWFGNDQNRPLRRPYDAMWRLGVEPEPSDFDLDINSTAIVRAAREYWRTHHSDRYPGDFMGGHGYLDKQTVSGTLPALAEWAGAWEEKLGRPLSLGVFESTGPFDATVLGRALSSHFKESDWIIHQPDTPMAWRTPRSRISPGATERTGTPRPSAAAARSRSTTRSKPSPGTTASGTGPDRSAPRHGPDGPARRRGRGK